MLKVNYDDAADNAVLSWEVVKPDYPVDGGTDYMLYAEDAVPANFFTNIRSYKINTGVLVLKAGAVINEDVIDPGDWNSDDPLSFTRANTIGWASAL